MILLYSSVRRTLRCDGCVMPHTLLMMRGLLWLVGIVLSDIRYWTTLH